MTDPQEVNNVAERFDAGETEAFINLQHVTMDIDTTRHVEDDTSFKTRKTRANRLRLAHTGCLCFNVFALGWSYGLMGPTFPDLRMIVGEDLATASWILTCWAFGSLLGSACGGVAYDRLDKIAIFSCVTAVLAIGVAAIPWCPNFPVMIMVHVLVGACGAILKTATTPDLVLVWREKARSYFQLTAAMFCIGAIVSSFAVSPFLAQRINQSEPSPIATSMATNDSSKENLTLTPVSQTGTTPRITGDASYSMLDVVGVTANCSDETIDDFDQEMSASYTIATENATDQPNTNDSMASIGVKQQPGPTMVASKEDVVIYGETNIHISYFISGVVLFVSALSYIGVKLVYGDVYSESKTIVDESKSSGGGEESKYILNQAHTMIFTIAMAFVFFLYAMLERVITQLLMTFVITAASLQWTKSDGSSITAVFYFAVAGGRLMSVFVVKRLTLPKIYFTSFSIITCSLGLLLASSLYNIKIALFISIGFLGFGMGPVFGSIFALISERIQTVTGTLSAIFFIANSGGSMLCPVLLGYLMDNLSQMWFVYFLILSFVILAVLIFSVFVSYSHIKRSTTEEIKINSST